MTYILICGLRVYAGISRKLKGKKNYLKNNNRDVVRRRVLRWLEAHLVAGEPMRQVVF